MNNPNERFVMRYCCGWCGAPTNERGHVLLGIPKEYLPFWGAVSVNGKCCEDAVRTQEEHEHEMLSALYRDA